MTLRELLYFSLFCAISTPVPAASREGGKWVPLFNGKNLDNWEPKINHRPLGENYRDTFVVENGILRVSYKNYPEFKDDFAHLIFKTPFSHYRLRMEYRFVGKDMPGTPWFAVRNSGVMIHGQSPETIGLDQPFPISVEAQILNGDGNEVRPTGNVCTPGTNVKVAGKLLTDHCRNSSSRTYSGDGWVRFEVEVEGDKRVTHKVNGVAVLEYTDVEIDPTDLRAMQLYLDNKLKDTRLASGYISLQGEGHPIDFRNIEIQLLPDTP